MDLWKKRIVYNLQIPESDFLDAFLSHTHRQVAGVDSAAKGPGTQLDLRLARGDHEDGPPVARGSGSSQVPARAPRVPAPRATGGGKSFRTPRRSQHKGPSTTARAFFRSTKERPPCVHRPSFSTDHLRLDLHSLPFPACGTDAFGADGDEALHDQRHLSGRADGET